MHRINNSILNRVKNKILFGSHNKWLKSAWFNIALKKHYYKKIVSRLQSKDSSTPIRVLFFVSNISMWKYDSLINLLVNDNRFEPIVIPYPLLWLDVNQQKENEKQISDYCRKKNFPFFKGYDIDTGEYVTARDLNPDFVCFTQPYNNGPYFWKVEKFYRHALIFYYPYGFHVEHTTGADKEFYNLLIHNVAWKIFYNTSNGTSTFSKNPFTRGRNLQFIGNLLKEQLSTTYTERNIWNDTSHTLKRIIWAPHHTISDSDTLPISNFLMLCDEMQRIAREYSDKIEIAFKPHPMLYGRLVSLWGKDITDNYYNFWKESPNTVLAQGEYVDLFATSDAMIHDSVTFMMDYLFTGKPLMFVNKTDISQYIGGLALECYKMHYQAHSSNDIIGFIENTVIGGKDYMKNERDTFVYSTFVADPTSTAAEIIHREMLKLLY